jgi:AraC-like DNA-binding protein
MPQHKHDYYEMLYVFDGSIVHNIEGHTSPYPLGQSCFLNHNIFHSEQLYENCTLVYLCFSNGFMRELFEKKIIKRTDTLLYSFTLDNLYANSTYLKDYLLNHPVGVSTADRTTINGLIETLSSELLVRQPGQQLMIYALLARLISYFLDNPTKYALEHIVLNTKSDSYLFNNITRYLENYPGRPSRKDLSEHFNYSADHLNRIIKKNSGMSLYKYNQTLCLKKAEYMLKSTNKKITAIVSDLGFANMSHFYELFKKEYGVTPKQYRDRLR